MGPGCAQSLLFVHGGRGGSFNGPALSATVSSAGNGRRVPGKGRRCRSGWKVLSLASSGSPPSPGSGPGAMSSDSNPCPAVGKSCSQHPHQCTWPATVPPPTAPSPVAPPALPPAPGASSTQGVATELQATGSRCPGPRWELEHSRTVGSYNENIPGPSDIEIFLFQAPKTL